VLFSTKAVPRRDIHPAKKHTVIRLPLDDDRRPGIQRRVLDLSPKKNFALAGKDQRLGRVHVAAVFSSRQPNPAAKNQYPAHRRSGISGVHTKAIVKSVPCSCENRAERFSTIAVMSL